MANAVTADEVFQLFERLTPSERKRLLRLIATPSATDAAAYDSQPVAAAEFSSDEDALSWDAEGWDDVG